VLLKVLDRMLRLVSKMQFSKFFTDQHRLSSKCIALISDIPFLRIFSLTVTRCSGPEPGYIATPICFVQAARVMLKDRNKASEKVLFPFATLARMLISLFLLTLSDKERCRDPCYRFRRNFFDRRNEERWEGYFSKVGVRRLAI